MVNWILGGIIVGLTVLIIVRTIVRIRRGQHSCCGGCAQDKCNCEHKP